jgi:glutathione S-transferase
MMLHTFPVTPNNRKVVAFIRHFDLPVAVHPISFKDQEQKSPSFLRLNPMGRVPVLVCEECTVWESNAILCYLAAKFPDTRALPTDLVGRAHVDRWLHWQSAHLTPMMGALKTGAEDDPATLAPLLQVLETGLAAQDYLLGSLTVCEFAIAPYLMTKLASRLDLSGFPALAAWRERVAALPGFVATDMRRPAA